MHVFTIAAREARSYFATTVGWLVVAAFLFLTGRFWTAMVFYYVDQATDILANPYASQQMNVIDWLLQPYFGNVTVVLLMICPAITMRTFAEEVKNKSIELLLTSPVTTAEIVLGKYLGAMGVVVAMLGGTAIVPFTLWMWWGQPDWGAVAGGYLASLFVSGSVIALGLFCSSSTQSSLVALIAAFAGSLLLWLLSWSSGGETDTWVQQLSLATHLDDFLKGVIRLSDVVYYVAFIAFFLFATHQRVEGYRWR